MWWATPSKSNTGRGADRLALREPVGADGPVSTSAARAIIGGARRTPTRFRGATDAVHDASSPGAGAPDHASDGARSPDLDLAGTIRPGLDILANEIVIALKKRTRFAVNASVYVPGLVHGDDAPSLLDYSLGAVERQHAALGRYTFAAQDAFTDVADVVPVIRREPPASPVRAMPSRVGPRLLAFSNRDWIEAACRPGEEPATYGETVTADVAALLAIMERVNLGKPVAEAKFREHEAALRASAGKRDAILPLIVHADRETAVLALSERLAERYELPSADVRRVFEFMIATTIDIEVDYLRRRIADRPG